MYEHIMVPVDGTPFSEQALSAAVAIAAKAGSALTLVMVEPPPPTTIPQVWVPGVSREDELDYMDNLADRARDLGAGDVSVVVLRGDPSEKLEAHREAIGATLTVMSTHGHGPLQRAWLGSIADRFVRGTGAPVLMIRPDMGAEGRAPDEAPSFGRVLVCLDGSEVSESALEPALEFGRLFEGETTLVRLIEYPNRTESVYLPDAVEAIEKKLAEGREAADAELDTVAGRLRTEGHAVDRVSKVVAHVAEGILECAAERKADIIVMASHGYGGVRRLMLGSVTDKVLRGSDHPVLVVPAKTPG
jgi:nucleotide-binding universal stress UspA family protein